jgi:hypothetical protein
MHAQSTQILERRWYPTPELMQRAADALFNPGSYTDSDRAWIGGQLQQRAAAINDGEAQ